MCVEYVNYNITVRVWYFLFFFLQDENLMPKKYFEVDFPTVVARKIHNIK